MNIALIGYGFMGRLHARVLSKLNLLSGIVELSDDLIADAKSHYDVPVVKSLAELDMKIDSVIIAVPTPEHTSVLTSVLDSLPDLKSILIEKPMVGSLEEYELHKPLWDKIQDKCIIGHIEVYNPVITHFMKIIEEGTYGQLRSITIHRKGAVPISRLSSLAGVIEDVGIHDFDIISRILKGKLDIYATGLKKNDYLNSAFITMTNGDTQAHLQLSREFSGRERNITVEMEKASVFVDLIAQTIEIRGLGEVIGDNNSVKVPHGPGSSIKVYGEPLQEEILNLKNIALGLEKPRVSIGHGISALRFVEAAIASIEQKKIITLINE